MPENDIQKEKLQQLFAEVTNQQTEPKEKVDPADFIEVDVLQLPPRREVHQQAKLSINFNLQAPFWRFSFVILLLIAVLFVLYYLVGDNIILYFT